MQPATRPPVSDPATGVVVRSLARRVEVRSRSVPRWRWQVADDEGWATAAIAECYGPLLARVLWSRNRRTPDECAVWLSPHSEPLGGWRQLPDLPVVVERVWRAIRAAEPIAVYGDYDVDGITATAIATMTIEALGGRVIWRLPDRLKEGYGLHEPAVHELADRLRALQPSGPALLLVLDCGTSNRAEIAVAAERGLEVAVIDHHALPTALPAALALVSPRRLADDHPCAGLTAAGLALYLAQGLLADDPPLANGGESLDLKRDLIALAALGTIADVAPLTGENRRLVARGLRALRQRQRPGLAALLALAEIPPARVDVDGISWRLAPRLNAAGRVEHPDPALRLLLTDNAIEAAFLATQLNHLNMRRQSELERIVAEARTKAAGTTQRVLVVDGADWSPGLVGLVASRLVEDFNRPAIVLGHEGELARGSARSIEGFNITQALAACGELLRRYGGHSQAAGLSIERRLLGALAERLDAQAAQLWPEAPPPPLLRLDGRAALTELQQAAIAELSRLAPCGRGNEEPLWLIEDVRVLDARPVGREGRHLQFRVSDGRVQRRCIAFGLGERQPELLAAGRVDLAAVARLDEWQGTVDVKLHIRDFRPSASLS